MKIIKKNNSLIALLLLATTFNNSSMESKDANKTGWVELTGKALVGGTTALKSFLSYIYSGLTEQIDPLPFTELPQDMQNTIISLVITNNGAKSLEDSGKTINALAQINHQLNNLINNPEFCLQIIWHLAERFNCSDEAAALALQTEEAKHRLNIQTQFSTLFAIEETFDKKEFKRLYKTYKDYVDLDFSYGTEDEDSKMTLLMLAAYANDSAIRIKYLLNTHAIDVNKTNISGMTALMFSALKSTEPKAVKLLCQDSTININQQTLKGNTAIMILCKNDDNWQFKFANLKVLLNAGADPEIANNSDLTPLQAIQYSQYDNQKIINLIQDAIDKKHNEQ